MKYFTPELHVRTSSLDDDVANASLDEWENARRRYRRRIEKMRPAFTPGMRQLAELRLHDAELLFLGRRGKECVLNFRPESSPESLTWLNYALLADPVIEYNLLPVALCTSDCLFLYDELEGLRRNGRPVFTQSILFSDGMQVQLKFRDVQVHVADRLAPVRKSIRNRPVPQPA